ncbi:MAG: DMT family transporter [Actinomycetota bacterium]|nr:DMT family transporter [Actinomycetota bacterium]
MKLVLGVILAIIATVLMNYGNYLQKMELANLPRIGSISVFDTIRAFLNSRTWLTAQGIQITGACAHNFAVAFAPLSVVEPIDASGIALLVVLAVTRLKEKAALVDWLGIFSVTGGVLMLAVTLFQTTSTEQEYRPVILWFFIILMCLISISSLIAAFSRRDEKASSFLGIGVGMLVGLTAIFTKMAWIDIANRWGEYRVAGFMFSLYFWLAIVNSVVCMVLFQTALQRGLAIVVVPLVTGFSNLIPIIVGFVAFREPFPSGAIMISLRLASIFLIIGGAILLSLRREGASSEGGKHEVSTFVLPGDTKTTGDHPLGIGSRGSMGLSEEE